MDLGEEILTGGFPHDRGTATRTYVDDGAVVLNQGADVVCEFCLGFEHLQRGAKQI